MSLRLDGDSRVVATDLRLEGSVVDGAPSATGVTVLEKGAVRHLCHVVKVDYTAVNGTAGTTADVTLWTLPAGFLLQRVIVDVTTVFAGGSISDCDVTVGSSAGGNQYLLSFDVDTAAIVAGDVVAEIGAGLVDATRADLTVSSNAMAATTLQCRFTSAGANLTDLTGGSMRVYIIGVQLPSVA